MDLGTALLLPGQGAYRPGVFAGPRNSPVTELLDTVDAVAADFEHSAISPLLIDPEAADGRQLSASDPFALQLAIFTAALVYATEVARRKPADVVLGHSMGEIAAAVHAGCFTLADGARIAAHRARALEQTAAGSGGMLALSLPARRAAALITAAELPGIRLAVVNAPRHVVVSGPEADLGVIAALADVMKVGAVRLPASYPFHNPLLATAQAEFAAAIEGIGQRPATTRMYSPALGGLVADDTDVKAMLIRQLTRPVDFLAAVRDLQTYGLESVVECGRAGLSALVTAAVGCRADTAERWLSDPAPATEAVERVVPAPLAAPTLSAAPATDSSPGILETLQQVYADRLGYPIEAMEADADLEGDLGVDSLKRMEILSTLIDRFGLHHVADDTRFALQSTLAGLARLIAETSREGASAGA